MRSVEYQLAKKFKKNKNFEINKEAIMALRGRRIETEPARGQGRGN